MNQALDACMSAENLDFQVLKKKFAAPGPAACKLIEDEVTTTRVKVTIQCTGSTTRSTTQVKSREYVVVNATIDSGGEVTTSNEEWRFVKAADCAKEKLKHK
jgi:flagella basal body P-ring formation protein FlgA